jgi:hypothetical protein
MSKKKFALCLSGKPGTMEFCYPSIKRHLLDKYNLDIFICSDEQEERMMQLYHPVKMEIYSQDEIDVKILEHLGFVNYKECQTQPAKDLSANWKVWRCGRMLQEYEKEHGRYDAVLLTRFDVKFLKIPEIKPEPNTVHIPRIDALLTPPDSEGRHFGGYSSQLCWFTSDLAPKIMSFFPRSTSLYRQLGYWHAEIMFKRLCDNFGIVHKLEDIHMMIVRGTNEEPLSTDLLPLSEHPEFIGDK